MDPPVIYSIIFSDLPRNATFTTNSYTGHGVLVVISYCQLTARIVKHLETGSTDTALSAIPCIRNLFGMEMEKNYHIIMKREIHSIIPQLIRGFTQVIEGDFLRLYRDGRQISNRHKRYQLIKNQRIEQQQIKFQYINIYQCYIN